MPRKKRIIEPGQRPDEDDGSGIFGELEVDPDSELPVHEKFTDNSKKLRKIKK